MGSHRCPDPVYIRLYRFLVGGRDVVEIMQRLAKEQGCTVIQNKRQS